MNPKVPSYNNFFWATFFILYDPLEISTGACPTPSGLEIGKTHHCALWPFWLVIVQNLQSLRVFLMIQNNSDTI